MEPIINPMYFYLIEIVGRVRAVSLLLSIIFGVLVCASGVIYMGESGGVRGDVETSAMRTVKRYLPRMLICLIISTTLALLIPSESTVIQMLIAKNITVENVQAVQNTAAKVYEDILNVIAK